MSQDLDACRELLQSQRRAGCAAAPAMREKHRGIWQTCTWADYRDEVRDFALGLAALGFRRGDKLSVIGDNRPQPLFRAARGAVPRRHLSAGLSGFDRGRAGLRAEPCRDLDHRRRGPGAGRQGAVARRRKLPQLRWIIFDDPRGLPL